MTAHNDKVEAVARALFVKNGGDPDDWQEVLDDGLNAKIYLREAQAILTLMEERNWLKADASRSVSSEQAPAGREVTYRLHSEFGRRRVTVATPSGEHAYVELQFTDSECADEIVMEAVNVLLRDAARSDSEDTQQAEGAATPANQLQELIEAAEKICAEYPLDSATTELQLALQNVKGSA